MEPLEPQAISRPIETTRTQRGARALLLLPDESVRGRVISLLNDAKHKWSTVDSRDAADEVLRHTRCEIAVVDANDIDQAFALVEALRSAAPTIKLVLLANKPSLALLTRAMRAEIADVLASDAAKDELQQAIDRAIRRARAELDVQERIDRLTDICRRLSLSRDEIGEQVEVLCDDLVNAYKEIADQVSEATMVSEFRTLLAQELDLEDLLRTALEYLLTKTGPTNAAVFLPTPENDWDLGAYVNYDCPRSESERFISHLATQVCPHLADESEVVRFIDAKEFAGFIGEEASFLASSQLIAFPCRHDDEALAIVFLFRDNRDAFPDELAGTLDLLREIFARQISAVLKVHHRAKPEWPNEVDGVDEEDDYGFLGGLAA